MKKIFLASILFLSFSCSILSPSSSSKIKEEIKTETEAPPEVLSSTFKAREKVASRIYIETKSEEGLFCTDSAGVKKLARALVELDGLRKLSPACDSLDQRLGEAEAQIQKNEDLRGEERAIFAEELKKETGRKNLFLGIVGAETLILIITFLIIL